jgi:hypothetical protein
VPASTAVILSPGGIFAYVQGNLVEQDEAIARGLMVKA